MGISLLTLCTISSITDIRRGIIKNHLLLIFFSIGIVLNLIYYIVFAQDIWLDFIINISMVFCISMMLYIFHIWAGGDAKFSIVASLLVPARFYVVLNSGIYTLFLFIIGAFILGFIFILADGVFGLLSKESKISKEDIVFFVKKFMKSYIISFAYVGFLNLLYILFLSKWIQINEWLLTGFYIMVAWIANYIKILSKIWIIAIILTAFLVLSVIYKVIPFSTNYYGYIAIGVLFIVRILMEKRKYKKIPASQVKKGMILSSMSSALLVRAKPNEFRTVSKEDLRDRLTQKEVETIKALSENDDFLLMIVRKMPFAVFLSVGVISYMIIGGVL